MKKHIEKPEHAGAMRNDLPGSMKVKGKRIYVRWNSKDIATGCQNTVAGWLISKKELQ